MGLINEQTRSRDIEVGKIEILRKFSFFEIESSHEAEILKAFDKNAEFEGERVSVELSKPEGEAPPRAKSRSQNFQDSDFRGAKFKDSFDRGKGSYKKGNKSSDKGKGKKKGSRKKSS